jgi:hypothetical protein
MNIKKYTATTDDHRVDVAVRIINKVYFTDDGVYRVISISSTVKIEDGEVKWEHVLEIQAIEVKIKIGDDNDLVVDRWAATCEAADREEIDELWGIEWTEVEGE